MNYAQPSADPVGASSRICRAQSRKGATLDRYRMVVPSRRRCVMHCGQLILAMCPAGSNLDDRGGPSDVERSERRLRARRGRLAVLVFKMFARRMSLPQIVVATNEHPDVIRALDREWSVSLEEGEWSRRAVEEDE